MYLLSEQVKTVEDTAQAHSLRTGEAEAGELQVQDEPRSTVSFKIVVSGTHSRPRLKKVKVEI